VAEFAGYRVKPPELRYNEQCRLLIRRGGSAEGAACMYVCIYIYTYIYSQTHTHTLMFDCTQTVYELQSLSNNTAVKHFYTNLELSEVLTGYIYHWGDGLVVTGRIRDIGQNVLQ
jgi:hypothetical protein